MFAAESREALIEAVTTICFLHEDFGTLPIPPLRGEAIQLVDALLEKGIIVLAKPSFCHTCGHQMQPSTYADHEGMECPNCGRFDLAEGEPTDAVAAIKWLRASGKFTQGIESRNFTKAADALEAALKSKTDPTDHSSGRLALRVAENPPMPSDEVLHQLRSDAERYPSEDFTAGLRAVWRHGCDAGMAAVLRTQETKP